MASAPQASLPPFYRDLQPLSSQLHGDWRLRQIDRAPHLARQHAIPVTAEEFVFAARSYPIVFATGQDGIPLALMGLNDGVNTFVDDDGALIGEPYVPAYVRRYPFMLAKLRPDADELSLCFDPSSPAIGAFPDGEPLFVDGQPSPAIRTVLEFCEQFEVAVQRTQMLVNELSTLDLMMDGELTIQMDNGAPPANYRGFRMVNEEKLRELRGDQLRKLAQSGALMLIYAHLGSLSLARDVFARQVAQGKMPPAPPQWQQPGAQPFGEPAGQPFGAEPFSF